MFSRTLLILAVCLNSVCVIGLAWILGHALKRLEVLEAAVRELGHHLPD